jgi:hypothetical protein
MLPTYPAVLRGGRLEWGAEGAPDLATDQPIPVHVTLLTPTAPAPQAGSAMAAALQSLAEAGGPSGFGDPVEWQRDVRSDRGLPGRTD